MMSQAGRPKAPLILTDDERPRLQTWAARPQRTPRLATRAGIVLACAEGLDHKDGAARLRVDPGTVGQWRHRCRETRLAGRADAPRPGAPGKRDDALVEEVVPKTPETQPEAATPRSTRGRAGAVGLSRSAGVRICNACGRQPPKSEAFKRSTDPDCVAQVRAAVGLDRSPPEHALVWAVDARSQVPARDRPPPLGPRTPGPAERRTPDDVRHGTPSRCAAWDVATGRVLGKCDRRHRPRECLQVRHASDAPIEREAGGPIPILLDHDGTPQAPAVKRGFQRPPEDHIPCTPTRGSWLNQVERCFAAIPAKPIRRGVCRRVAALEGALMEDLAAQHEEPRPFVWTAGADLILDRVKRVCERTSNSGH